MADPIIPITKSVNAPAPVVAAAAPKVNDFSTELIDLPSQGHFYSAVSPLASGRVELKYMTAREEDILTNQNLIKKGVVLDELLKALIVTPGVQLDDILICDKNAIFVAARRLAYGDKYDAKLTCPKCGEENEVKIDLNEVKPKEFDFTAYPKGENKFSFVLPGSKKTITYRLLTHKDEQAIDAELKGFQKLSKNSSPEMTTRLKYMIVAVDGDEVRSTVFKAVDNMLAKDSMALRKHVRETTPDLDMTFNFTCAACGHNERIALPLGVDFFWPST